MANQQFMYTLPAGKSVQGMMEVTRQHLSVVENMETQIINGGSANMTAIQARTRNGGLKQLVGMDKASRLICAIRSLHWHGEANAFPAN